MALQASELSAPIEITRLDNKMRADHTNQHRRTSHSNLEIRVAGSNSQPEMMTVVLVNGVSIENREIRYHHEHALHKSVVVA